MTIDKNADFTPSIPDSDVVPTKLPYNTRGGFKFWAQKVIPLVYDDSLSYYEVLCKVVNYLNNVIQNVDNLNESVNSTNQSFETLKGYVNTTKDTLINTYNELQDYVNTYFDNLDVQDEINAKLDAMADSGELTNLLAPFIPDLVTQWLNNHVTPTSPVVDNTLSISGAAADAKVTGDNFTELKEDLSESVDDLKSTLNSVEDMIISPFSSNASANSNFYAKIPTLLRGATYLFVFTVNTAGSYSIKFGTDPGMDFMIDTLTTDHPFSANVPVRFMYSPSANGIDYTRLSSNTVNWSVSFYQVINSNDLKNEIDNRKIISGKYWKNSNGKLDGDGTYVSMSRTELIKIKNGDEIYLSSKGTGDGATYYIADADLNILATATNGDAAFVGKFVIQQQNAAYLAVNTTIDYSNFKVVILSSNREYATIAERESKYLYNNAIGGIFGEVNVELNTTGYIDYHNGRFNTYGDGVFACTDFIPVDFNLHYRTSFVSNGDGATAYYDENKQYISGSAINDLTVIPNNAKYMRITDYNANKIHSSAKLLVTNQINDLSTKGFVKVTPELQDGYIDSADGEYHNYSVEGYYKCTQKYHPVIPGLVLYVNATPEASAGLAFYKADLSYAGTSSYGYVTIPDDAVYFKFSDAGHSSHENCYYRYETEIYHQMTSGAGVVTIACTGDSVTEGMATNGAHTADYGKSPYPARLKTLLVDNGYNNVFVYNYGHGGERTPDIATRIGGYDCYFAEDVTIPADNSWVSLGAYSTASGRVTGTKIKVSHPDSNGNDYCVYFTQISTDTNPVSINGIDYTMKVENDANWIHKTAADGKETVIKAGTFLFTANKRNPSVNVFYGGINDQSSLTLERWIDFGKSCGAVNGGKYIVLGSTHALWNNWSDVIGADASAKYAYYKKKANEAFGIHFIDLYQLFFENAMSYALASGYFTDKTAQEIAAMEALLAQHIVPAEFSHDGQHQGDVHLSEEGYQVIGMLIFDRLKQLGYI